MTWALTTWPIRTVARASRRAGSSSGCTASARHAVTGSATIAVRSADCTPRASRPRRRPRWRATPSPERAIARGRRARSAPPRRVPWPCRRTGARGGRHAGRDAPASSPSPGATSRRSVWSSRRCPGAPRRRPARRDRRRARPADRPATSRRGRRHRPAPTVQRDRCGPRGRGGRARARRSDRRPRRAARGRGAGCRRRRRGRRRACPCGGPHRPGSPGPSRRRAAPAAAGTRRPARRRGTRPLALDRDAADRCRGDAPAQATTRLEQQTSAPAACNCTAAAMPETPPPTTIASCTADTCGGAGALAAVALGKRADVVDRRADQAVVRELLEHVGAPAGRVRAQANVAG